MLSYMLISDRVLLSFILNGTSPLLKTLFFAIQRFGTVFCPYFLKVYLLLFTILGLFQLYFYTSLSYIFYGAARLSTITNLTLIFK